MSSFFTLFLFLGLSKPNPTKYITDTENILIVEGLNEFSEEYLIKEINRLNFKFPHIVNVKQKPNYINC